MKLCHLFLALRKDVGGTSLQREQLIYANVILLIDPDTNIGLQELASKV